MYSQDKSSTGVGACPTTKSTSAEPRRDKLKRMNLGEWSSNRSVFVFRVKVKRVVRTAGRISNGAKALAENSQFSRRG